MLSREQETFVNQQHSHHTTAAYSYDIEKWNAFLGKRKPTREIALAFRKSLEERLKPRSAARTFNTCRAYYRWLGGENPFDGIKSPKRMVNESPIVPTDAEMTLLTNAADNSHDRALVALLLNGLRISEASGLAIDDWKYVEDYKSYFMKVLGKGFKERMVPANDETVVAVTNHLKTLPKSAMFILGRDEGRKRLTNRQIQYTIEKLSAKAGITRVHPHQLRHNYATRLVRAGVGLEVLKDLLGHTSIMTTSMYVTLDLAHVVQESRKDNRNG